MYDYEKILFPLWQEYGWSYYFPSIVSSDGVLIHDFLLTVEEYPFQFREILIDRGPIEKIFPQAFRK